MADHNTHARYCPRATDERRVRADANCEPCDQAIDAIIARGEPSPPHPGVTARITALELTAAAAGNIQAAVVLGELCALVAASEGMSDSAEVTMERLRSHWARKDEWVAARMTVHEETTAE